MKPTIGMLLHASCSDCYVAEILAVGKDANEVDTLDVRVFDLNEIVHFPHDDEKNFAPGYESNPLAWIETPKGGVIIRGVQWEQRDPHTYPEHINVAFPEGGCYRCTRLFSLVWPGRMRYRDMCHPLAEELAEDPRLTISKKVYFAGTVEA